MMLFWVKLIGQAVVIVAGMIAALVRTRSRSDRITAVGWMLFAFVLVGTLAILVGDLSDYYLGRYVEEERSLDRIHQIALDFPLKDLVLDVHVDSLKLAHAPGIGITYEFEAFHPFDPSRFAQLIINRGGIRHEAGVGWTYPSDSSRFPYVIEDSGSVVHVLIPDFALGTTMQTSIERIRTVRELSGLGVALHAYVLGLGSTAYAAEGPFTPARNPIPQIDVVARSSSARILLLTLQPVYKDSVSFHVMYLPEEWIEDHNVADLYQRKPWEFNRFLFDVSLCRPYLRELLRGN
jgi:hypothetical protein